jgi:hypothetical protein
MTARSGGQRVREHLIRRSGQTVQACPIVAFRWPDVPWPSFCVDSWLWPWLQSWLQSRGCPQPERANPNRIGSSPHGCPDRFKLDQPSRPVFPRWCRTVVNCNPQIRSHGASCLGPFSVAPYWADVPACRPAPLAGHGLGSSLGSSRAFQLVTTALSTAVSERTVTRAPPGGQAAGAPDDSQRDRPLVSQDTRV